MSIKRFFRNIIPLWILLLGVVLATGLVWQATRWAYTDALDNLVKVGGERLTLYSGTLREALSRYAYLPYVLSQNTDVEILLKTSFNLDLVNRYLQSLNSEAGSEALYVVNSIGETLASSNWQEPLSFVGQNYGFRPYFTDAKAGLKGRFFAIGVTTGRPGYFMSHPVLQDERFLGATVVKVNLAPLQDDWHKGGETVLVSDANGVLFLSSRNDWKYRTLTQLSEGQRTMILAGRQYGNQSLELLPLETVEVLTDGQRIVRFENTLYLMLSRSLPGLDWQLHHVVSLAPVQERGQSVAAIGTVLALLILALGLYARERRQKQISRRKAREAEAIQEMNLRLQEEIAERSRTENILRETQAELVQTGKLAALGHMAAGIVHELNQPISAIRTQAASGRLLLDRQETGKVRETLAAVTRMTEHMASITAQLKTFAHKTPKLKGQVGLQDCLNGALAMTAPLFSEFGISLSKEIPDKPFIVNGDRARVKQVLVNLIRNAVDAMRGCNRRDLRIKISSRDKEVEIFISDSGSGIADQDMEELFTPFFTTKEVGEGMGLGLSISYRIVTDLGGTIRAQNLPDGGAQFIVRLPLVKQIVTKRGD
ncbi:MAG: sensor histidine kinase [Desulfuromusa sp.]|nr:sensor histidine kinase [Desulfuromusa sp.]